jgi:hypothetical protein
VLTRFDEEEAQGSWCVLLLMLALCYAQADGQLIFTLQAAAAAVLVKAATQSGFAMIAAAQRDPA